MSTVVVVVTAALDPPSGSGYHRLSQSHLPPDVRCARPVVKVIVGGLAHPTGRRRPHGPAASVHVRMH